MFLKDVDIRDDTLITDIVTRDYRTANVFRKYGIEYCCGGKRALQAVCETHGLDTVMIRKELNEAIRMVNVSNSLNFNEWDIHFLIDYIKNIHHDYLVANLPEIWEILKVFTESHKNKYPYLGELMISFTNFKNEILPHIEQEEKIIFPYIRQIANAYTNREPYAALLVRTLRKPLENMMDRDHEHIGLFLDRSRELTSNYIPPPNACVTHGVAFSKLRELDDDLSQHLHLENNILFPRAILMEKELLLTKD